MGKRASLGRLVWAAVIFLVLIGLAVVARRMGALLYPAAPNPRNPAAGLDKQFGDHLALTLVHILPAALFVILGPLQFVSRIRQNHPKFHRRSGRVFLLASAIVGVTGLAMSFGKTIGGGDEKSATILFGSFFLFSLAKAFWHVLHRQYSEHREWMIRGFATGLAVATIRPIVAMFVAAALIRGRVPQISEFFGTAFWIGFTLQTAAAELWIRSTRAAVPAGKLSAAD